MNKSSAVAMASHKRSAPPANQNEPLVIEILDSDDEDDVDDVNDARKRLKTTPSPRTVAGAADNDNDDGGGKIGPCCPLMQARSIKKEPQAVISLLDDSEHPSEESTEVQVLTHVEEPMEALEHAATSTEGDIEVIGCKNQTKLPHMRQHCTEHQFVQDVLYLKTGPRRNSSDAQAKVKKGMELNSTHCDMCYCYVCDVPAKECQNWKSDCGSNAVSDNHCLASDKGADAHRYKTLRNGKKGISTTASAYPSYGSSDDDDSGGDAFARFLRNLVQQQQRSAALLARRIGSAQRYSYPTSIGAGPFDPQRATPEEKRRSTKCRKCGWYSRLSLNSGTGPGCNDWCHKCGRVCEERSFARTACSSDPYEPEATDIFLGSRTIPFTIHSHDPRKLDKYKQSWIDNEGKPGWEYNQQDMDQDMFDHRFGERPQINLIVASIPILSQDKIPDTGQTSGESNNVVSANETEYIVLAERSHRVLLEEVGYVDKFGKKLATSSSAFTVIDHRSFMGDIRATWNKSERKGTFTIRMYMKPHAFDRKHDGRKLAQFFGAWFDIFPYSLTTLTRGMKAKKQHDNATFYGGWSRLIAPPYDLHQPKIPDMLQDQSEVIDTAIATHNTASVAFRSGLSFTSSSAEEMYGGVCDSNNDFASVLKSFFTEIFMGQLAAKSRSASMSFLGRHLGIVAHHRTMRRDASVSRYGGCFGDSGFCSYLRDEDLAVANEMIETIKAARRTVTSLDNLMTLLENLGHASVPHVDGLTVELLDFQKQTVQWALEREKTPGGLQSFFWARLPLDGAKTNVYFNPILGKLSTTKPALVRGGVIAEQMGLGKTVISLALILQNPAPASPLSGTAVRAITNTPDWNGTGWNPNAHSGANGKGEILSRGTLVICHVSLVGQWIEESKSKLSDPGLVYPYHGNNRKRDAEILAKNAIVVTTYATLASDKFYHAKKGGPDYCAPCEQVRWWRIICDESHALRDGTTKQSNAVLDLVGDHKWCVSGTPMNTSTNDLKTQLRFLGIENVDEMFQRFNAGLYSTSRSRRAGGAGSAFCGNPEVGPFMFFMRNVMMRHSMKQTYVGTTTELMSLPPKEVRTMTVVFSQQEEAEYKRLEGEAKEFYEHFKAREGHQLSKHYLLLFQKLTPLRIACSGGAIPEQEEDPDSDNEDEGVIAKTEKKKKEKNKIVVSTLTFQSKMKALVKELERIRDEEPHAKSLIFSQFTSTLKFLQVELPKHGFDFRTLSGDMTMKHRAKALHDFQHDPPTTIFLLSMRAGACGINLTQANRVFILEPAFNPALEAQAIGRVWRMGQKKKVEIIRMITDDTVEARLREMLDKKYGSGEASAATSADAAMEDEAHPSPDAVSEDVVPAASSRSIRSVVRSTNIGSIRSDRTTVLTEEFDLLFGLPTYSTNYSSDADISEVDE